MLNITVKIRCGSV